MSNYNKSKSSLVLMEVIITLALFMTCGSVCVLMFVNSHLKDKEAGELSFSVMNCESVISILADGNEQLLSEVYNCTDCSDNYCEIFFDSNFNPCDKNISSYTIDATYKKNSKGVMDIELHSIRNEDQHEIYSITTKVFAK